MKSFRHFLMESIKLYCYTIKIAGDPDKKWLDMFTYNLNKFSPVSISDPVTTPIQANPYGFPGLQNQPVTTIKVEFRYPCIEPYVKQIARLLNYDENMVRMIETGSNESFDQEAEKYAEQQEHSPLLTNPEKDSPPDAKQASKDYGDSYLSNISKQRGDSTGEITFAEKPPVKTHDPFKKAGTADKDSPISNIKLPPRPKTSARL